MQKVLGEIFQTLQKLLGLHRQLMELVRAERQVLVQADPKAIQNMLQQKQDLIDAIGQAEAVRIKLVTELSSVMSKPAQELTLPKIIIAAQSCDLKLSEQLRSTFHALTLLIQRVIEQNRDNQLLLERSLENIGQMKRNILGSTSGRASTYSQQGQKVSSGSNRHLISREA